MRVIELVDIKELRALVFVLTRRLDIGRMYFLKGGAVGVIGIVEVVRILQVVRISD